MADTSESFDIVDWADNLEATTGLPEVASHSLNAIEAFKSVGALMFELRGTILTRLLDTSTFHSRLLRIIPALSKAVASKANL